MEDNEIKPVGEPIAIEDEYDYTPVQWTREELETVAEGYREIWENADLPEEECPF